MKTSQLPLLEISHSVTGHFNSALTVSVADLSVDCFMNLTQRGCWMADEAVKKYIVEAA